jgi:hypothetical protein
MVVRAAIELGVAGMIAAAPARVADVTPGSAEPAVSGAPARLVLFEDFTRPT